jgi:hypothetical protein
MTTKRKTEILRLEQQTLRERSISYALSHNSLAVASTGDIIKSADKIYNYILLGTVPN